MCSRQTDRCTPPVRRWGCGQDFTWQMRTRLSRCVSGSVRLYAPLMCGCLIAFLNSGCGDSDSSPPEPEPAGRPQPQAETSAEAAAAVVKPRLLPVLSPVFDYDLIRIDGDTADSSDLQRKVVVAYVRSKTTPGTSPVIASLIDRISPQSAASGLRFVSLAGPDGSESQEEPPEIADSAHGLKWFSGTLPGEAMTLLCGSDAAGPDSAGCPGAIVLFDRSARVRARYPAPSLESVDRIMMDIGHLLPEFSPADFGYAATDDPSLTHLAQPSEILDLEWLDAAAAQQQSDSGDAGVNTDFTLTDQVENSGITYDPQIVDDQRWRLLVNHYDHGNGIGVADVNLDGHLDLLFVSQTGHNELYAGTGDGRFRNITEGSGLSVPGRICVTATFADLDNDGDPDVILTSVRSGNLVLSNDGHGHFTDVTSASGMEYTGHSSAPVVFDYDRDGLLDVFLCNVGKFTTEEYARLRVDATSSLPEGEVPSYYVGRKDAFAGHLRPNDAEASILFRNTGGLRFEDVTESTGLDTNAWSGDATPIDANGDGWTDLFVLNMQGHDEYFENQEGRQFVRKTSLLFEATSWGAMGVKVFDFDGNGLLDLFVTDMHSDMSEDIPYEREREKSRMQWPPSFLRTTSRNIFGNSFFLQQEPGRFQEVSDSINAENYWPWGVSIGDLNADGFPDAFLASSMCFPYRYGINSVLLNDHGKVFRHREFVLGVEPRPAQRRMKPWFDIDCADEPEHPMAVGREGTVRVWSCLGTRSSAFLDIDSDGDLDIITSEFNSPPQVLVSDLAQRQPGISFLRVSLRGTQSNRDGLGARVTVVAGDRRMLQVHDGKSGYLSQSSGPLYFGLGDSETVDAVEVEWPSGIFQKLDGPVSARELLQITEPEQAAAGAVRETPDQVKAGHERGVP